tara:strand:- start:1001 stop:1423 length:423 start_codon:yes stop_codon:yes gene_type:complete
MGATASRQKVGFEDVQCIIKEKINGGILINTLTESKQNCLIQNTVEYDKEVELVNSLMNNRDNHKIIIYGENSTDNTVVNKYDQLKKLGFQNVYMYIGGLFEWLLLQDIYGEDNFPTTQKENDLLKYKSEGVLNRLCISN